MQPSAQSSFQKLNVDNTCQKTGKIRYYIFEILPNFTASICFVPNILSRILDVIFCKFITTKSLTKILKREFIMNEENYIRCNEQERNME